MARKLFCDGCDRGPLENDEVRVVEVRSSMIEGIDQSVGLKTDKVTKGVLCGMCAPAVHAFVGENDDREVSEDAAAVVLAGSTQTV